MNPLNSLVAGINYTALKKQGILPKTIMFNKLPKDRNNIPKKVDIVKLCDDVAVEFGKGYATTKWGEWLVDSFRSSTDKSFEPTWSHKNLLALPSIYADNCVYELVPELGSSRIRLINLLFGYVAVARAEGDKITKMGLVLPFHQMIEVVDVSGWNSAPYLEHLMQESDAYAIRTRVSEDLLTDFETVKHLIGSHVSRNKQLRPTLDVLPATKPIQIFLGTRLRHQHKFTEEDVVATASTIAERGQRVYVHATYTLNLSRPAESVVEPLLKHVATTKALGGLGCVIHLGKKVDMSMETAVKNMYDNVVAVASQCSPGTPLLLETDSGGSLYDDPSDLADFWLSLPESARRGSAVCLDTCHVFAAGYDNLSTLKMFEARGVPVKLIHYNDSVHGKGSKLDRHAAIGEGQVGLSDLIEVALWAVSRGIDLVTE